MSEWFVAPAAAAILGQASAIAPDRSTISDGTIGDQAHASRRSDHNPAAGGEVLAADLTHDPAHGIDAHGWADRTRLRCKSGQERRVTYQISNSRIYSESSGWEWVPYDGENAHEKHVHTSISKTHADDTSWWGIDEEEFTVAETKEIIRLLESIDKKLPGLQQQERDRNRVKAIGRLVRAVQEGRPVDDQILGAIEAD